MPLLFLRRKEEGDTLPCFMDSLKMTLTVLFIVIPVACIPGSVDKTVGEVVSEGIGAGFCPEKVPSSRKPSPFEPHPAGDKNRTILSPSITTVFVMIEFFMIELSVLSNL